MKFLIFSQFLERCDRVLYMEHGRIAEMGKHADLVAKEDGGYKHLLSFDQSQRKDEVDKGGEDGPPEVLRQASVASKVSNKGEAKEPTALTKEEESPKNAGAAVLFKYLNVSANGISAFRSCGSYYVYEIG